MEEWKKIEWYEWLYEVSNFGRVINIKRNKIMNYSFDHDWYKKFNLCKNSKWKNYSCHRLVAKSFIENTNNKPQVNHKDWNKENNRVENLEWCTQSENVQHAFKTWLVKNNLFINNNPSKWKFGKYSNSAKKVSCYSKLNEHIKDYDSIIDAERELWVWNQNISKCCKWVIKSAWWFKWKYRDESK